MFKTIYIKISKIFLAALLDISRSGNNFNSSFQKVAFLVKKSIQQALKTHHPFPAKSWLIS